MSIFTFRLWWVLLHGAVRASGHWPRRVADAVLILAILWVAGGRKRD